MGLLVAEQRIESVKLQALEELRLRYDDMPEFHKYGEKKYGEPFWRAEVLKTKMRRNWCREISWQLGWDLYRPVWEEFWEQYEEINRVWIPDDPVYSVTRPGIALSTTLDLWTLTVGTAGQLRVLESYIAGEAAASAVNRTGIALASTNGVTPTAYTPEKFSSRSPAAVATAATNWTTQPVRSANSKILHAFNAFGGSDRWVPQPGEEIYLVGTGTSEQFSFRSLVGTSTVSAHCVWEEM